MAATRSLASSRRKKPPLPFYEAPPETSAKIIASARESVRAIPTDRPYTPAPDHRILFGGRTSHSRPPSAFSIGPHHFIDERPNRSETGKKLTPIEKSFGEDNATKVPTPDRLVSL